MQELKLTDVTALATEMVTFTAGTEMAEQDAVILVRGSISPRYPRQAQALVHALQQKVIAANVRPQYRWTTPCRSMPDMPCGIPPVQENVIVSVNVCPCTGDSLPEGTVRHLITGRPVPLRALCESKVSAAPTPTEAARRKKAGGRRHGSLRYLHRACRGGKRWLCSSSGPLGPRHAFG
jgi:hypothetical protein